jgi:cytochrome c peroxidase
MFYSSSLSILVARIRASTTFGIAVCTLASTLSMTAVSVVSARAPRWTPEQRAMLRSLSLTSLEPLAPDRSNRHADDLRAAALGRELFFDTRLSGNAQVSCATCHQPDRDFQDSKPLANGVGTTARRTMPIAATAHSPWMFWDGRSDSQWSQALGPLESAVEHGGTRTLYAHVIAEHYRESYEAVFGALPDLQALPRNAGPVADTAWRSAWTRIAPARREDITRIYANIGKAIAAYERRIEYAPSRFDRYVDAELAGRSHTPADSLSPDEEAGLRIFIGKANCTNCHNGALFTDQHFHNTGVLLMAPPSGASHLRSEVRDQLSPTSQLVAAVDSGRTVGVRQAIAGEFSCMSKYSDATPDDCDEVRFAVTDGEELVRAFKTPSLRSVASRAPYMHAGQFATLEDVVAHYNAAPRAPFGHSELKPLHLAPVEQRQLVAFLRTLSSPIAAPAGWLEPPAARR